jgi:hypothetical protein
MPASTSQGVPYVLPADAIADYPVTSEDLAAWLDLWRAKMPRAVHAGAVTVPVSNAVSATLAVTFPVGKFTATPIVTVSTSGTSQWVGMSSGSSSTGFTATVRQVDGTAATASPSINYSAIQL